MVRVVVDHQHRPARRASSSGMPATSDAGSALPGLLGPLRPRHRTRAPRGPAAIASRSASLIESSTRQQVESEATGPNTAAWSASVAMSLIALTAVGDHHRQIGQHPARIMRGLRRRPVARTPPTAAPVSVVWSARSASSRDPACDTTPAPSADTSTAGRVRVACTWKVPSCSEF